jgi:hypothetical protein
MTSERGQTGIPIMFDLGLKVLLEKVESALTHSTVHICSKVVDKATGLSRRRTKARAQG